MQQLPTNPLQYHLTKFRTHTSYLIFQIAQLILSLVIILLALISPHLFREPLVLWLEFVLLCFMAIDLFGIRMGSEGGLWGWLGGRRNRVDLGIFGVFLGTFGFMVATQGKGQVNYEEFIQGDDVVVIAIIICRYIAQIYQIVNQIQDTKHNMACQQHIQNFDLNKAPYTSVMQQNDVMQDEIIRQKIKAKKSKNPNSSPHSNPNPNPHFNPNQNPNQIHFSPS